MKNNRTLTCFVSSLLAFATSMAIAQQNPNGNSNGKVPAFATMRSTLIFGAAGIGLGHSLPKPDITDENGIVVDPPPGATAPSVWGIRVAGLQGNGVAAVPSKSAPGIVNGLPPVAYLVGGAVHLLALTTEGELFGWGQSNYGETGCKMPGYQLTPCKVQFSGDPKITYVDAGEYNSMALTEDGDVYTWGHYILGQLGHGIGPSSHVPRKLNLNSEKARVIGAAYEGGFAVTTDHVWAWGDNEWNGLGVATPRIAWTPVIVPSLDKYVKKIIYIGGGNGWGQALLSDGTVIGWGVLMSIGQGVLCCKTTIEPVVVTTNIDHMHTRYVGTTALTRDGKILTWGQTAGSAFPMVYGHTPTLRQPVDEKIIAVGGGKEYLFYRTESGRLFGVGHNHEYKIDQSKLGTIVDWPGLEIMANP